MAPDISNILIYLSFFTYLHVWYILYSHIHNSLGNIIDFITKNGYLVLDYQSLSDFLQITNVSAQYASGYPRSFHISAIMIG